MNKIAIIYWSGSGNTEAMANAIKNGVDNAGIACDLYFVSDFNVDLINDYDGVILGCPAMGAEVLEESEFQPVYDKLESFLKGKSVALFGSYGWGTGEWMDTWEDQVKAIGADLFEHGLIVNEMPDESSLVSCEDFAKRFAMSK